MATFHLRDLDALGEGDHVDALLFEKLNELAGFWPWAGHAAQAQTIAELLAYREKTMSPAHRARFDAYVAPRRKGMFWNRFPEGTAT
jgi:hypothetical protein